MGGHGALTIALTYPERFKSCSAFAPIAQPSTAGWSKPAFEKYLGSDPAAWRAHDATALIEDGKRFPEILVDQAPPTASFRTVCAPGCLRRPARRPASR